MANAIKDKLGFKINIRIINNIDSAINKPDNKALTIRWGRDSKCGRNRIIEIREIK